MSKESQHPSFSEAARRKLQALDSMDSPAVGQVLIDILRTPDDELPGLSEAEVVGLRLTALNIIETRFWNDATVRGALEEMALGPDPFLRSELPRTLESMDIQSNSGKFPKPPG